MFWMEQQKEPPPGPVGINPGGELQPARGTILVNNNWTTPHVFCKLLLKGFSRAVSLLFATLAGRCISEVLQIENLEDGFGGHSCRC